MASAVSTPEQRWVLALASTASFMMALDTTAVSTALSTIQRDLGASLETLQWTINAYVLTFAVLLLTGAALGDRFGRRRMLALGLGLFTTASAACALAPGVGPLIAARAVQGAGAALVLPLAMTHLSAAFPPRQRGRALGLFSGLTGLATFSGPFIGGAVAQGLAWQWLFWINIPIGVLAVVLVRLRLDESTAPSVRFDFGGVLLATGGALGLVWGLVRGNDAGWGSTEVVGAFAVGVLLTAAFVRWELRTAAPMLPMRFFRNRSFAAANASIFCVTSSLYGTLFFLAQYLQIALGHGPFAAGLRMMAWTGTVMVFAPVAGILVDRLGERPLLVTGMLLQALGGIWLALVATPSLPYDQMVAPLLINGCGISLAMPAAQKAVVGAVAPPQIGQASGVLNMLRQLGGVFGIAVCASAFAATGGYGSPAAFTHGFTAAMWVTAALAVVGAAAGAAVQRVERAAVVAEDAVRLDELEVEAGAGAGS
ncbi:DHA2 family efflux MFS transporter permease subunit [Streptacidiphilus carbonis]|jgi:EmrB/QacA subfamily drug resistance transporter|uniref:DHA2 family efflux MFS transporter permease subunit n=1 Tax=Streptacidiphilus carbonis TaxID=105422 RepID=UPI0005A84734|nr:DHA2 family efflux MFS transporter permease subunit [Streptacidiphilus carbonis]